VDASNPFYTEIQWFAQRGITTGWGEGTYRPHEATNRDATAAFLFRYAVNVKGLGA
jgi:subtilisin-like serine protease